MRVVAFAAYLTRTHQQWRPEDYDAYKFVRAIKGRTINGYAWVPVGGLRRKLVQANAEEAVVWFAQMAHGYLENHAIMPPYTMIPIPSSSCTVNSTEEPRALALAQAIAARTGGVVWDGIRWQVEMIPSSQGGPRDPRTFYEQSVLTEQIPVGRLIFIDDVVTSGSHLTGLAARMRENGNDPNLSICAGRTVHEPFQGPFALIEEDIADFDPNS
jgi:predicted amidophosphoribosyltransferase